MDTPRIAHENVIVYHHRSLKFRPHRCHVLIIRLPHNIHLALKIYQFYLWRRFSTSKCWLFFLNICWDWWNTRKSVPEDTIFLDTIKLFIYYVYWFQRFRICASSESFVYLQLISFYFLLEQTFQRLSMHKPINFNISIFYAKCVWTLPDPPTSC